MSSFIPKNKFEKLVDLVGFIVRICTSMSIAVVGNIN